MEAKCVNGHDMRDPRWKLCPECGEQRAQDHRPLEERVTALEEAMVDLAEIIEGLKTEIAEQIEGMSKAAATPSKKDDISAAKRLWNWANTPIGKVKKETQKK